MKRTFIVVTAAHIARGCPCKSKECAVALAIREHLKPEAEVSVSDSILFLLTPTQCESVPTPERVVAFIACYDSQRGPVEPIEFWLDVPEWALKEAA